VLGKAARIAFTNAASSSDPVNMPSSFTSDACKSLSSTPRRYIKKGQVGDEFASPCKDMGPNQMGGRMLEHLTTELFLNIVRVKNKELMLKV